MKECHLKQQNNKIEVINLTNRINKKKIKEQLLILQYNLSTAQYLLKRELVSRVSDRKWLNSKKGK